MSKNDLPKRNLVNIVIPCFNEAKSLSATIETIDKTFRDRNEYTLSVTLVDDGSRDETWRMIQAALPAHPSLSIVGLKLNRNFGKTFALAAGMLRSPVADYTVLIDADGEQDPSLIPNLIARCQETSSVCIGLRTEYVRTRRSRIGVLMLRFLSWLAGVHFDPRESEYMVIPRRVLSSLLGDPRLGITPMVSVVYGHAEVSHLPIRISRNAIAHEDLMPRSSRFGTADLIRKGIHQVIAEPWSLLLRVSIFAFALISFLVAYGFYVGIVSVSEGSFLGIGSVIITQVIFSTLIVALLLFAVATLTTLMHFQWSASIRASLRSELEQELEVRR